MNKRSSSCGRRDIFSFMKSSDKTDRQHADCSVNTNSVKKVLRSKSYSCKRNPENQILTESICQLVLRKKFDDCAMVVRQLIPDDVDTVTKNLPVEVILNGIPDSLKLIEVLYSKNCHYHTDKNPHEGITSHIPPDILLNKLLAWVCSLDEQKPSLKIFQHYKQCLLKTLKHIFSASPILRKKLTKKLLSLERSLDAASQQTFSSLLQNVHPMLLTNRSKNPQMFNHLSTAATEKDDKNLFNINHNCTNERRRHKEFCGSSGWMEHVEQLKTDFVALFSSPEKLVEDVDLQNPPNNTKSNNTFKVPLLTIEAVESRLYRYRRILDAIEPLESLIVHVGSQLRRFMADNKEIIFNCIELPKELNLRIDTSRNPAKIPLTSSLSLPLTAVPDITNTDDLSSSPSSPPSVLQSEQPSSLTPVLSSVTSSPVSSPPSSFPVLSFLSRMVRGYSKVVTLIKDEQFGPRVFFHVKELDSVSQVEVKQKKPKLSSHSFNTTTTTNNGNTKITKRSQNYDNSSDDNDDDDDDGDDSAANLVKYHTLPRSKKNNEAPSNSCNSTDVSGNNKLFKIDPAVVEALSTARASDRRLGGGSNCGGSNDVRVEKKYAVNDWGLKTESKGNVLFMKKDLSPEVDCKSSEKSFLPRLPAPNHMQQVPANDLIVGVNQTNQLIRRYGNLYSKTRAEAMKALDEMEELQDCDQLKKKILLSVVVLGFRSAKKSFNRLQEDIHRLLGGTLDDFKKEHSKQLNDSLTAYLRSSSTLHENVNKNTKDVYEKLMTTLRDYPCLKKSHHLMRYVEEILLLCWFFVIQNPPLVPFYEGRNFDTDLHERYCTSDVRSNIVKAYVWPGLLEGNTGRCAYKAIVIT